MSEIVQDKKYKVQINEDYMKTQQVIITDPSTEDYGCSFLVDANQRLFVDKDLKVDGNITCNGVLIKKLDGTATASDPNSDVDIETMNSGIVRIDTQKGGTTSIGDLTAGGVYVDKMTGGIVSIKPKDKLIVDESGGDGTYKISVAKSKFSYNRLYKIWMSNESSADGEYGLFSIPNNSTRQSTAYIYRGGDSNGRDDYEAQDHYELAIRAKKGEANEDWNTDATWDTNFQSCKEIAFVRVRIEYMDWATDKQNEGTAAKAAFLQTRKWKIWDTGIDITSW